MKNKKGFTLIELLIVVLIIGIVLTLSIISYGNYMKKTRDSKRLSDIYTIETAIRLFYSEYGYYPPIGTDTNPDAYEYAATSSAASGCGRYNTWCALERALNGTDITPLVAGNQTGTNYLEYLPRDPLGNQSNYVYYYDADSGDSFQSFGLMVKLEYSNNFSKVTGDDGFYNAVSGVNAGRGYETGTQPRYCRENGYGNWLSTAASVTTMCASGPPAI